MILRNLPLFSSIHAEFCGYWTDSYGFIQAGVSLCCCMLFSRQESMKSCSGGLSYCTSEKHIDEQRKREGREERGTRSRKRRKREGRRRRGRKWRRWKNEKNGKQREGKQGRKGIKRREFLKGLGRRRTILIPMYSTSPPRSPPRRKTPHNSSDPRSKYATTQSPHLDA